MKSMPYGCPPCSERKYYPSRGPSRMHKPRWVPSSDAGGLDHGVDLDWTLTAAMMIAQSSAAVEAFIDFVGVKASIDVRC